MSIRPVAVDVDPEEGVIVMFGLNVRLNLSGKATTESLSSLQTEPLLQVLGESTWTMTKMVIRGVEGMGDVPGVRGGSGGL